MKKLAYVLMMIALVVMVMTSCEKSNPTSPTDEPIESLGKIRLVPLNANDLSKVITDENGHQWMPKSEIFNILTRATVIDIDFGSMNATRSLMYVVVNEGDRDVFNIEFTANDLTVVPYTIGLITVSAQGTEVSAYPIITMTKEHILPLSGIGSLLSMNVGEFTDTLSLTYHYVLEQDTIEVVDSYTFGGVKMGTIIDVIASGQPILNYPSYGKYYGQTLLDSDFYNGEKTIVQYGDSSYIASILDTTLIINSGNTSARIRICSRFDCVNILDTTINTNDTLDVSGIFSVSADAYYGLNNQGNIIKIGPTEYAIKLAGVINTTGMAGLDIRQ